MTPEQLASAVRCYGAIRRAVALAGKTPAGTVDVLLSNTRTWQPAQVWLQLWPLFFYSGMKTEFAAPRAAAAAAGHWFDDFSGLASAIPNTEHSWHVREARTTKTITKGKRKSKSHTAVSYIAVGTNVRSFCSKSGIYYKMPHRTGAKVVYRISELAALFKTLSESAARAGVSFVDQLAGGDATAPNALDIAFKTLRPVTGPITALHGLSDLGFLCHKPDIWMCRLASWCGWTEGYSPEDLIKDRREGWQVLRHACLTVAQEAQRTGLVTDANPLRALDWYVANYGMHFNPAACPCSALLSEG